MTALTAGSNAAQRRAVLRQFKAINLPGIGKDWIHAQKKTYSYRERDEVNRSEFLEQIAGIEPSRRVYVDETGMDERDDYGYGRLRLV